MRTFQARSGVTDTWELKSYVSFSESRLPREREEKVQRDLRVHFTRREHSTKPAPRGVRSWWKRGARWERKAPKALRPADVRRQATQQEQLQPEVKGGSGRSTIFSENKRRSEALTWRVQRGWIRDSTVPESRPLSACSLESRDDKEG